MRRSIAIAAALYCAGGVIGEAHAGSPLPLMEPPMVGLGGGSGWSDARRALERAEKHLRAAEHALGIALRERDDLVARRSAARRDLDIVERRLDEGRRHGRLHEIRILEQQRDDALRDARSAEAEMARLKSRAADAFAAADAARDDYFRRAEQGPVMADARARIARAEREAVETRDLLLHRLRGSFDWERALAWRDDVAFRLEQARQWGSQREADRLRADLARAEARLSEMEADALARDPAMRDAERRIADARRNHDAAWARIERDLEHDPAHFGALADGRRYEQDAARLDALACDARELAQRIGGQIDDLHHRFDEVHRLESEAAGIVARIDRLGADLHKAEFRMRRAEDDLKHARLAYQAALAACAREDRRRDDDRYGGGRGGHGGSYDGGTGYRDRGDRYQRNRGGDGRQRTRDD